MAQNIHNHPKNMEGLCGPIHSKPVVIDSLSMHLLQSSLCLQ